MECDKCKPAEGVLEAFFVNCSPEFRQSKIKAEMERLNAKCGPDIICLPLLRAKKKVEEAHK